MIGFLLSTSIETLKLISLFSPTPKSPIFHVNFLPLIWYSVLSESFKLICFGICFVTSTSVNVTFETFSTSIFIVESQGVFKTIEEVESCCLLGFVSMFSLRINILGPLEV